MDQIAADNERQTNLNKTLYSVALEKQLQFNSKRNTQQCGNQARRASNNNNNTASYEEKNDSQSQSWKQNNSSGYGPEMLIIQDDEKLDHSANNTPQNSDSKFGGFFGHSPYGDEEGGVHSSGMDFFDESLQIEDGYQNNEYYSTNNGTYNEKLIDLSGLNMNFHQLNMNSGNSGGGGDFERGGGQQGYNAGGFVFVF